jgi:hypothetical protein
MMTPGFSRLSLGLMRPLPLAAALARGRHPELLNL